MKENILLIGGGGHCRVVIEAIRASDKFDIFGIIDKNRSIKETQGIKVVGNDNNLKRIYQIGCRLAFITVGSVGDISARARIDSVLRAIGFTLPVVRHPSAVVAGSARIAAGTFIGPGTVIGPNVLIGKNVIINTKSSVDHDCRISDFVHIAPGVSLSGTVKVGKGSHIGVGSSVIEGISIGAGTMIGAGSVLVSDMPAHVKAFGNPCRVMGLRR